MADSLQKQIAELTAQGNALLAKANEISKLAGTPTHRQFAVTHTHTTRVKHKLTGDEMVVNTDDLDPEIHAALVDVDAKTRNHLASTLTRPPVQLDAADDATAGETGSGETGTDNTQAPGEAAKAPRKNRVKA